MNCRADSYYTNPSEPVHTVNHWTNIFKQRVRMFLEQRRERFEGKKAVRHLSELDNRMLKDIGLIRADVERVALSEAPEKSLVELEMRRHRQRQ